jgi:hypothetical protein
MAAAPSGAKILSRTSCLTESCVLCCKKRGPVFGAAAAGAMDVRDLETREKIRSLRARHKKLAVLSVALYGLRIPRTLFGTHFQ